MQVFNKLCLSAVCHRCRGRPRMTEKDAKVIDNSVFPKCNNRDMPRLWWWDYKADTKMKKYMTLWTQSELRKSTDTALRLFICPSFHRSHGELLELKNRFISLTASSYLQSVAGLTGVYLGVGEGANFINRRTSQCLLQEYCCNISLPFRFQVSFKVKDATFLGHVVPTKTLNTLNDNIIPTQSFLLSLYMLTNKGYFLILFAPNDTALEENQAENPIFKNKLFTFWVIHGLCYTR